MINLESNNIKYEFISIDFIGQCIQKKANILQDSKIIYGKILDENLKIIKNVNIEIFDINLNKKVTSIINNSGEYIITDLNNKNEYLIIIKAIGYKEKREILTLNGNSTIFCINFKLESEYCNRLYCIYGKVFDSLNLNPINNAFVKIFKICKSGKNFKEIAYTNIDGEFIFSNLKLGKYKFVIYINGYKKKSFNICICGNISIIEINISLCRDSIEVKGTISGTITNNFNDPINEADIVLYEVLKDNSLNPIKFTKTNENGVYLFDNMDIGKYLIKATKKY